MVTKEKASIELSAQTRLDEAIPQTPEFAARGFDEHMQAVAVREHVGLGFWLGVGDRELRERHVSRRP